ncbi:MAG TPA: terminase large subunit [Candidatus Pullichristensenella excrementipullorum]|nr:terminase large subunit [Candidatus Pullichristensenella excrementipullorum]
MNYITLYNDALQRGEIPAGRRIKAVYARLAAESLQDGGKYAFDEEKANRPIEFIERFCHHSKGEWAGQPVRLELFQKAFIQALFGFVDRDTGLRRYREAFFLVGRKNGKSTLLAGLALYMLIADGEGGAEVYSTATKYAQARLLFDECHNMVKQSPDLSRHMKKRKSDLYYVPGMAKLQPLSRNSDSLDGLNASFVIMDELHGVKDRNLYEVMRQSQSARRQPLLVMITTAGTVRECIFDDMYNHACAVADGAITDDAFLPILYELDRRDEWMEPGAWMKANPSLGAIKKTDDLTIKVQRAKQNPVELSGVLCKEFNIRETVQSAWLSFDAINCTDTFDMEEFRGAYCIGGVDLSITTDLTCASLLLMKRGSDRKYIAQMYWLPADSLQERVKRDKIPYDKWFERGLLRLCVGNSISYSDVTQWFIDMVKQYELFPAWVYYDSYSARYFVEEMQMQGFNMVRCIQGAKTLSLPMQMLGTDLQAHRVNYNNNPILKWCLTNTGIQADRNGNIVPVKNQSPKQRIDGTAALLDCYVGLYEHYNEFTGAI